MTLKLLNNFSHISEEYNQFNNNKLQCTKCSIYNHYQTVVPSEGNAKNPIFVFVGQSPGQDEVDNKRPFIGKAGQRLRQEIRKYDIFNKNNTLITNLMPCRPKNNKFPKDCFAEQEINKQYEVYYNEEIKIVDSKYIINHCYKRWLHEELLILKPKIIIILGSDALEYVAKEKRISHTRGRWMRSDLYNCYLLATYHPSYVLRCEHDATKQNVVTEFSEDIQKVTEEYKLI
jgi:DNA polymerase